MPEHRMRIRLKADNSKRSQIRRLTMTTLLAFMAKDFCHFGRNAVGGTGAKPATRVLAATQIKINSESISQSHNSVVVVSN